MVIMNWLMQLNISGLLVLCSIWLLLGLMSNMQLIRFVKFNLRVVKTILRYLYGTLDYGFRFLAQGLAFLCGCFDAD